MRKLIASTFLSLDEVLQAPGGPEEDPTGGFAFGGWSFAYWDDAVDISAAGFDSKGRELVLGRKTYEIFEAYWPYQAADNPIAKSLNATKKHVASRSLKSLQWNNSHLLNGDAAAAIKALKSQPGQDLQIIGSGNLIQSLQAAALIDEYNVWTYPVVLGRGKRLFEATAEPSGMRLVSSKTSATGVVMSVYAPAGEVPKGSFATDEPSAKELARRAKMAKGTLVIVDAQVTIAGTKAAVWAAIADIEHAATIVSGIVKIEVVEKPAHGLVGLRWRETRILFDEPATVEKWITDAVENESYKTRAESHGFVFLTTVSIVESSGGITLTSAHDSQPQGFVSRLKLIPMGLFFKGVIRKAILQDLNDIKTAVERMIRA